MGLGLTIVIGILGGIITQEYLLFGLPAVYLLVFVAIVDFRKVFYLLLASIPLSTELNLPGGFATDFPSELLVVGLMFLFIIYVIRNGQQLTFSFLRHPITLLLLLHIAWIGITMLHADNKIISFKFFLAKIWYVLTYYFLAGLFLKTKKDVKIFFYCVFYPLLFTVVVVMIRHAAVRFSFQDINFVLNPFYRNHVTYAAIMVVFFPFLWYATTWVSRYSYKWWGLIGSIFFFLSAIYFSYTRAAYVSLVIAVGAYIVIRFRLMKGVLGGVLIVAILGLNYVSNNNKYLDFAPDFNKTISHNKFDNLLEATAKGEDISTMERVYRWVAGFQMVKERPWFGFGPGNFYSAYTRYTLTSFRTYVSDNPEQSGIHSYFLMTAVEQGIIGLLIFLLLCFTILLKGEQIYHQTTSATRRKIILMAILSFIIINALLLINDMVETDKVGSFFFMVMAILVNMDLENQRDKEV